MKDIFFRIVALQAIEKPVDIPSPDKTRKGSGLP
jgi:hypothetical protein